MEKRDEFEFDSAGEAIENYISLDHVGRLGSRWVIIGLIVGGLVALVVGAALTTE